MKKVILSTLLIIGIFCSAQNYHSEVKSPRQTLVQQFSYSDIVIDYGRPSVNGREIFGDLVPFDKVWRLGANKATTIEFNQGVRFDGELVKKGKYSMFAIPSKDKWTIILNEDANQWGAYRYDSNKDVLRIEVPTVEMHHEVETLLITLNDIEKDGLILSIVWDDTGVSVPIEVADSTKVDKVYNHLKAIKEIED